MDSLEHGAAEALQIPRFDDGMVNIQELLRVVAEALVNEIMDAQAEDACADGNQRNGYRERTLVTSVGAINLRIPKLRRGSYFPEDLLVRYSRVDRAVIAAVSEMVASGVSTRKVERVAQTLGIDRMSASQVSRICESLDDAVADLQGRDLSDVAFPYIWVDATYVKCREGGHVSSCALVTAIGAGGDGYRRLLGLDAVDTESYAGWLAFLRSLRERGVDGVLCVTSDAHEGLRRAIEEVFPGGRLAEMHRAPYAQRRVLRAHPPEAGGRAGRPARGLRRARPRARARALPPGLREDRRHMSEGGRVAGGRRGRCPGLPGLPLRASPPPAHQQRAGAGQPGAQAQEPGGAGVPVQEVADTDTRRRVLRDGRGLGGQEMVHRGVDRSGVVAGKGGRAGGNLRRLARGTRKEDHRDGCGRQPDWKEGCLDDELEYEKDSRCLHQQLRHYLSRALRK